MPISKYRRIHIYLVISLFVLCLPLFLLTSHLSWAVNEVHLYEYAYDKYDVSQETGLSDEQLEDIAAAVILYLNSGERNEALDIFNEGEMAHLQDVRGLVIINYILAGCTFGYLFAFVVLGFIWLRKRFAPILTRLSLAGSALTLALLVLLGIWATVDFDGLFTAFHRLFLPGDSGVLIGYMPCIFTEGFFGDTTLFIAAAIIVESLIIGGISGFFVLTMRRRNELAAAGGAGPG